MQNQTFEMLHLAEPVLRAVKDEGYERPTPIQAAAIPPLVEGKDLIGCAQTGTGKTAAFALPILTRLAANRRHALPKSARVLVLTPTRELAAQVGESFRVYGRHLGFKQALVFGGVGQGPQVKSIMRGTDILVATPGRLLDLMNQRHVVLSGIEIFVLDEADRMLDMGFLPDIKKIIAVIPKVRQTLLFSATMAPEIMKLAEGLLKDPVKVAVTPPATTVALVEERLHFVDDTNKRALLADILKDKTIDRMLVFTRTKHGANRLVKQLMEKSIRANAIHGNKSQTARMAALDDFKKGRCRVLVATDIAARGIDVDGITHVVNFDLPMEPESYVHRIGRTARAGAKGTAISFCGADERFYLKAIERLIKRPVPVFEDHPYHSHGAAKASPSTPPAARNRNNPNRWGNKASAGKSWRGDRRGKPGQRFASH